jgi:hypothetical protein
MTGLHPRIVRMLDRVSIDADLTRAWVDGREITAAGPAQLASDLGRRALSGHARGASSRGRRVAPRRAR